MRGAEPERWCQEVDYTTALRALTAIAAGSVIIGSAITLLGWAADIRPLTDWNGDGISMYPNAALAAGACGIALLLLMMAHGVGSRRTARIAGVRILAAFAAVIGGLTLFQHLTGIDLRIDSLVLERPWDIGATAAPMRMGPPASATYVLLGTGLLLATRGLRARRFTSRLALVAIAIASLSQVGYWFGVDRLYAVAQLTGIAWQTSTMLLALGVGLLASVPEHGIVELFRRQDPGGAVVRRLLLPVVVIPLLLIWLRMRAQEAGLFDLAFGVATVALAMVAMLVAVLWWTASRISRQFRIAQAAERAVHDSETRLKAVLHQLPVGVGVMDLRGRWILSNPMMEQYAPTMMPPVPGTRWRGYDAQGKLVPTHEWPAARALRGEVVSPGIEMVHTPEDGREIWMRVSSAPLRNEAGDIVGATAVIQDIDEIKRGELALRDADRRKDHFLATLAHELRNPLGAIRMAVALLTRIGHERERREEISRVIERQSEQLVRLIDDLLDVGRITRGTIQLRKERVELQTAVEHAVEMARPMCERKGVRLFVVLPPQAIVLDADPVRLTQIIGNLLNNACKCTDGGGHVRLVAEQKGGEAIVRVQDTGIGIAAEDLPRLFDMFWQSEHAQWRSQGGLGIGLSLTKTLTELHGGTVEAHSDGIEKGSSFIVRLPMPAVGAPDMGAPQARPEPREAPAAIARRVLVVDDHGDALSVTTQLLRLAGHHVHAAETGEEGLEAAQRFMPELILLDIGLPGMDGYEVARRIRGTPWGKNAVLVAMTGWGQEKDKQLAAEAGFDLHITKPAGRDVLERLLARLPVAAPAS